MISQSRDSSCSSDFFFSLCKHGYRQVAASAAYRSVNVCDVSRDTHMASRVVGRSEDERTRACCESGQNLGDKERGEGETEAPGYSRQVMTHCFLQKALTMLSIIAK